MSGPFEHAAGDRGGAGMPWPMSACGAAPAVGVPSLSGALGLSGALTLSSALGLLAALSLASAPAHAQTPAGDLTFPARGAALRPTGTAVLRTGWMARHTRFAPRNDRFLDADFAFQEVEVRVPIGGLVLEAAAGVFEAMLWENVGGDHVVALHAQNPEVGAYFSDAPSHHWRYELGGSISVAPDASVTLDSFDPTFMGIPLFEMPRVVHSPDEVRAGWLSQRHAPGAVIGTPRLYAELAPIDELVLAARVEVPIQVTYRGAVDVYPQASLSVAFRDTQRFFLGLETRITSWAGADYGDWYGHAVGVAFVPFARVGFLEREYGGFVRLALTLPVGPAYLLTGTQSTTTAQPGYVGGELAVGALY